MSVTRGLRNGLDKHLQGVVWVLLMLLQDCRADLRSETRQFSVLGLQNICGA